MLVAQGQHGERFSLIETWSKEDLLKRRREEQFFCPVCQQPVQLKLGDKVRHHFAHLRREDCIEDLENESSYHIDGKTKIYHWLKKQGIDVQLEKYLPNIKQRPDLYVTYKGKNIAIEYQCSSISKEIFQKRTDAYKRANVHVLWILGGKKLKRKSSHTFHITPFQELFTTNYHHYEILSYCPMAETFLKLGSSIYSFSPQSAISHLHVYSADKFQFPKLFTKEAIPTYSIHREWCVKKKKWRSYLPSVFDSQMQSLLVKLYEEKITYLPAEIGVPLPSSFALRTSPILWQGYLFLSLLHPLKVNENCTLTQLCDYMNELFRQEKIALRQLYFHQNQDYSLVVKEFAEFLVARGILQKVTEEVYQKMREFHVPSTIEEACALDYETTLLALRQNSYLRLPNKKG